MLRSPPWNDVDFQRLPKCGVKKCFFESRSDSTVGYLITKTKRLEQMQMAQDFEDEIIAQGFGGQVCSLPDGEGGRPQALNITTSMACLLSFSVRQPGIPDEDTNLSGWDPQDLSAVAFQKRRKAPEPNFLFKAKYRDWEDDFSKFVKDNVPASEYDKFLVTLEADLNRAIAIYTAYPHFLNDFQGLIDPQGHFIHMDVDRMYSTKTDPEKFREKFSPTKQAERLHDVETQIPLVLDIVRTQVMS
jgi:hypothetical protein